jgi:hypothetical protein
VADEVVDPRHSDWKAALSGAIDVLIDAFRNEAGFRGLRVGDVIDLRPAPTERTFNSIVANRLIDGLVERFGVPDTAEARFHGEAAIEIADALLSRAFARDPQGDAAFLRAAHDATRAMLAPHLAA